MAWTSPRTWIAGEKPTASELNTHIKDNLNALYGGAFVDVTFNGSWANFGTLYEEVSYALEGRRVHLRGMAKHATTTTTGLVFTLPAGYRPAKQRHFKLDAGNGWAVVTINTDGTVNVASYLNITGAAGSASHLSFDGVSFDVAA